MTLPTIGSYGQYSSENYGAHCLKVCIPMKDDETLTVWFSYSTPVAFWHSKTGKVVRENEWGPTTGKHLNWIESDKKRRVSGERFQELWSSIVNN